VIWVALALSAPFAGALLFWPMLRRLAVRNLARRPVEASLVVVGSLLGTAIITGSLILGTTIDRSIRAIAYDHLGPVDEVVAVDASQRAPLEARLARFSSRDVDGKLSLLTAGAAIVSPGPAGGVQPRGQLVEVDFPAARAFGGDPAATGITGSTPRTGRAAVTTDVARRLRVRVGVPLVVFAYGRSETLTVDRVLPRRGIAGFWLVDGRQQSYNVLVAPGTISRLAPGLAGGGGAAPPQSVVAISNRGGVETGAARTAVVERQLDQALRGLPARATPVKQQLLDTATKNGKSLTQLYFTLGMFAVAAGVLLLINVFVMLADERRPTLGMLRAIGMRRTPLVVALAAEGWLYALVASVIGAVLGIGFGWVINWRANRILGTAREVNVLRLAYTVSASTVLTGFALGLLVSLAAIVVSSARIARFNVILAIRGLDPPARHRRRRVVSLGLAGGLLGAALTVVGISGAEPFSIMLGPTLVLVGAVPLLNLRFRPRAVGTVVSLAVLAWAMWSLPVLAALNVNFEIPIFLAQGLLMAAAAVVLVTIHQEAIARAIAAVAREALPVRVGLAYPLARKFRTAMTIAMFAVVILTLVYMSILSAINGSRTDSITARLSGGFGVIVTSNPSAPIAARQLAALPGVKAVAPLGYALADFTTSRRTSTKWPATGIGAELVNAPPRLRDRGRFASDRAAWRAVEHDPTLVIVDNLFLTTAGGPQGRAADVGGLVTMTDPLSGRSTRLRVAAIAEDDYVNSGAFVGQEALRSVFGDRAVASRFFVKAGDPNRMTQAVRTAFVRNGADAETVRSDVATILAQSTSFFTLMQQFVGAGLVVGVAGISVMMVRAVRERRREVGVLRALGLGAPSVARSFMVESSFMAMEGVGLGVLISVVATYVFTNSGADWAKGWHWQLPLGSVLVIVAIAMASTVIAAVWPARRAARVQPAAAIRIAD
jgi:putative ABC transport system permease protein